MRFICNVVLFVFVLGILSPKTWAQQADKKPQLALILEKNHAAITAFENYSFKKGVRILTEALQAAIEAGFAQDPQLAETYVLLGIGDIAGSNDLYRGVHWFVRALRLNDKVLVPKQLITPQIQNVFASAQKVVKAVSKPPIIEFAKKKQAEEDEQVKILKDVRGLVHDPIDEAKPGYPIPIKAAVGADLRVNKMFLYFRVAGKVKYDMLQLKRSKGMFRGEIPVTSTFGRYIHYYIEAIDPRGRLSASNGSATGPNVIIIR